MYVIANCKMFACDIVYYTIIFATLCRSQMNDFKNNNYLSIVWLIAQVIEIKKRKIIIIKYHDLCVRV